MQGGKLKQNIDFYNKWIISPKSILTMLGVHERTYVFIKPY